MQHFDEMPRGYRWMTEAEMEEYYATENKRWGWLNDQFVGLIPGSGLIRQWDCMVEFGLDHDHDPEECERTMDLMNAASDYSDAYDGYYESREYESEMLGRPLLPNEY